MNEWVCPGSRIPRMWLSPRGEGMSQGWHSVSGLCGWLEGAASTMSHHGREQNN